MESIITILQAFISTISTTDQRSTKPYQAISDRFTGPRDRDFSARSPVDAEDRVAGNTDRCQRINRRTKTGERFPPFRISRFTTASGDRLFLSPFLVQTR